MVAEFKLYPGNHPVYPIERDAVERHVARQPPWFVTGETDRHFAVCPYCDNPIQLKALYARVEKSPLPYGSHVGKAVEGFRFNADAQAHCPSISDSVSKMHSNKRAFNDLARSLIETAVAEFDRVVLILRDDLGFRFSDAFAGKLLERWFASEGYLYPGAHLRNLPWMVGYFGGAQNLFGQPLGRNTELADAIRERISAAGFDRRGHMLACDGYVLLKGHVLEHRTELVKDAIYESVTFRILDFSQTRIADAAPIVFESEICCRPARFEGLMHTAPDRAKRDKGLLVIAEEIFSRSNVYGTFGK